MIAQRIKQARIAAAMTQDEVVAALSAAGHPLSKAGLSKYERGGSVPAATTLRALGKVFGVSADFFIEQQSVSVEWLAFRKASAMTRAAQERVKTLASAQVEAFVTLRQALEPTQAWPKVPRTKVGSLDDAEAAAARVRRYWNLGEAPIESVTAAIEDAGGVVVELDTPATGSPTGFDGLSGWVAGATPVVVVASSATDDRRRFSLAHELGHLCMDVGECTSKDAEKFAHRFAAAFLVPPETARRELGHRRLRLDLRELSMLKLKHGLSMQAWVYRATDLGIIDAAHGRSLFAEFSAKGWRRDEPVRFEGRERPMRLRQLTVRAHAEGLITSAQADRICPEAVQAEAGEGARPVAATDARVLMKLPRGERERLLARAAMHVRGDYGAGGALSGFEAGEVIEPRGSALELRAARGARRATRRKR